MIKKFIEYFLFQMTIDRTANRSLLLNSIFHKLGIQMDDRSFIDLTTYLNIVWYSSISSLSNERIRKIARTCCMIVIGNPEIYYEDGENCEWCNFDDYNPWSEEILVPQIIASLNEYG